MGAEPPKGQQLEDHYFGAIDEMALNFMAEVEAEAWKLGIPIKTRHNEVAPHQYEAAPIYQHIHIATDQNQLLMDLMRRVAKRQDLAVLFHEKPFAGVNGSGKHCNWSIEDDRGRNLLDPGRTPEQNVQFLFFLVAVLMAVYRRSGLIRAAIAHSGNDHRLGANEAPPAIVSAFIGERLGHILDTLAEGKTVEAVKDEVIQTGLEMLPEVQRDNTDRNRTSPFAFTGNKFELRAVGSSQSLAMPVAYLSVAVAEALDEMCDTLEKHIDDGQSWEDATLAVVREAYRSCSAIVFNGNNYGDAWVAEAEKRGLPNAKDTPAALATFGDAETAAFLERYGVFLPRELRARYVISLEKYSRALEIEAVQLLRMAKTGVVPAAMEHQRLLATSIQSAQELGLATEEQSAELAHFVDSVNATFRGVNAIRKALREAPDDEGSPERARYLADALSRRWTSSAERATRSSAAPTRPCGPSPRTTRCSSSRAGPARSRGLSGASTPVERLQVLAQRPGRREGLRHQVASQSLADVLHLGRLLRVVALAARRRRTAGASGRSRRRVDARRSTDRSGRSRRPSPRRGRRCGAPSRSRGGGRRGSSRRRAPPRCRAPACRAGGGPRRSGDACRVGVRRSAGRPRLRRTR